jgi:hypothetical protein
MRTGLTRTALIACVLAFALAGCRADDLTAGEAAEILRRSPDFTTRRTGGVRRELAEVRAVRRLGTRAIEVEFTWRNSPSADPAADLHVSAALFRREGRVWGLASLYKID